MGTLYLVATPIGNLEDITLRALRVLAEADALACEDTRQTRKIFERHGIARSREVFSYHEHNEERAGKRILALLREGKTVAVCTDGGVPAISDPGYRIVRDAIAAGHVVEAIPGATAVATALVLSGLPTSSFTFKGFPPRKPGPRRRFFETERELPHTLIVFESPFRLGACLADALAALGNRDAAVCIEMTKKFEQIERGTLQELAAKFANAKVKGEVTVVIAGNHSKFTHIGEDDDADADD